MEYEFKITHDNERKHIMDAINAFYREWDNDNRIEESWKKRLDKFKADIQSEKAVSVLCWR